MENGEGRMENLGLAFRLSRLFIFPFPLSANARLETHQTGIVVCNGQAAPRIGSRGGFRLMRFAKTELVAGLRTYLVLGRVPQLPTVWSNCLAGWLLSGGSTPGAFIALCLGTTCLFWGGVYLNDACDAQFDALHRRERPIPAGAIGKQTVWLLSVGWFACGALILVSFGKTTAVLTVLLLACIVVFNLLHKLITFSSVLLASCRFLLYLVAGTATEAGVSGLTIWSGLALAAYVVGLGYLARQRSTRAILHQWPCYLMAVPVVLAWIANDGGYHLLTSLFSVTLLGWVLWCLRYTFGSAHRNVSLTVAGLQAGIVLVDLLAVVGGSQCGLLFGSFFLTVLLLERFAPSGLATAAG